MFHRIRAGLSRTPIQPLDPHPHPVVLVRRARPHVLGEERRVRRTVLRLALDGVVVRSWAGRQVLEGAA